MAGPQLSKAVAAAGKVQAAIVIAALDTAKVSAATLPPS